MDVEIVVVLMLDVVGEMVVMAVMVEEELAAILELVEMAAVIMEALLALAAGAGAGELLY